MMHEEREDETTYWTLSDIVETFGTDRAELLGFQYISKKGFILVDSTKLPKTVESDVL